jgi:eukaryotic-like serine/threonine-protein kinase
MGESLRVAGSMDDAAPELGKYAPFARLGTGGMADVFLAVARGPVGFNKLVVVKRLRASDDTTHVRMFLDEARLAARLSHPNIVNTYEVDESRGKLFITMEYLEGQSLQGLQSWLRARSQTLSEGLAIYIAVQALKGLHYAHELADYDGTPLGVVHRDVSPHNLMITYGGEVKVLDFGIAKAAMNVTHTETGMLKGKVRYMAPEQAAERSVDRRADVFAFGIVLWEMIAQRQLYVGDSVSILTRIGSEDAPPLRTVRPEVSPELEAIVARALRRKVDERYQTAEEMRVDLERLMRGKSESASDVELARLVTDAFATTRDNVRARIKTFIAALPNRDSSPSMPTLALSVDNLPVLTADVSGQTPSAERAAPENSAKVRVAPRRWPAVVGVVALLAALSGGAYALWGGSSATSTTATAAPPPPTPAPTTAAVHLATSPTGASIVWNGRTLGRTPADVQLDLGRQTLVVSLDGYETEQVALDVKAGTAIDRELDLRAVAPASAASASASSSASHPPTLATAPVRWAPVPAPPTPSATTRPKIRVLDDTP